MELSANRNSISERLREGSFQVTEEFVVRPGSVQHVIWQFALAELSPLPSVDLTSVRHAIVLISTADVTFMTESSRMDTPNVVKSGEIPGQDVAPPPMLAIHYEFTPNLPALLDQLGVTLLISTYQAGKILAIGSHGGELKVSQCHVARAMGLAVDRSRIAVGTRRQVHFFRLARDLGPRIEPKGTHSSCWLPRGSFYTGDIQGHELAWGTEGLWAVNTMFSTLCTLDEEYNFVPRWQPLFITELSPEDRCHLNGFALEDGRPKYVTVMAQSNSPGGWRANKGETGCIIDVDSNEIVTSGLAMPHSPRLYHDQLWVLDSGRGRLATVDVKSGTQTPVEEVPGYTRGLAFSHRFAFVGLSRIRETSIFSGIPIAERRSVLKCGIGVVNLDTGRTVATFQFKSGVDEIFAVELIPERNAHLQPMLDEREDEQDLWFVPTPKTPLARQPQVAIYARPEETHSKIK